MSLSEKQAALVAGYKVIEDPLERFSAIVAQAAKRPPLPDSDRIAENLVPGCTSQVWVTASVDESGRCHFRSDADSPIVKAVAALVTDFYSGHLPEDILAFEPTFLDDLQIASQLTPTRRNGLRHIQARIQTQASTLNSQP